ncbi:recombinase family protein [candidate division KSB1 bacterium]|nr:recombinase family protein [candidate division KSB1 bacterium]
MHPKIKPQHLEKTAYLYLRQSTPQQLIDHKESVRYQLSLKDKLTELGFKQIEVIDSDLGKSGAGYSEREGFAHILQEVYQERAGAVSAWEASRLARSHYEWQNLIRFCQITGTLVIDESGVYDPTNIDDNAMLGIKATLCEYELNMLQKRARAGALEKARRGELYTILPPGYYLSDDGVYEMVPDERIRDALKLVFDKFDEFGSAHQVLLWFRDEKVNFPKQRYHQGKRTTVWEPPLYSHILSVLKNPAYAGTYVYGRCTTKTVIRDNKVVKITHHPLPMEKWKVIIPDHHAGYISWERYLKNQQRLCDNDHTFQASSKGAVKKGIALLTGLLHCGQCGRTLQVKYSGRDSKSVRYFCRGNYNSTGQVKKCYGISGKILEAAIVREVLKVIEPAAISAALEAEQKLSNERSERQQRLELALEQARYESDRRARQFNAIEPENSLVIRQIQAQWDEALFEVDRIQRQLDKETAAYQPLNEQQRQQLYALADDLPRVWNLSSTDERTKKRIIRALIENIVVRSEPDSAYDRVAIHWFGGVHQEIMLKRPQQNEIGFKTDKKAIDLIAELAAITNDGTIARILNRCGLKTAGGTSWNQSRVSMVRHTKRIRGFSKKAYENSRVINIARAAAILTVSPDIVRRMIKMGLIQAKQVVRYAPWMIDRSELEKECVIKAVESIKQHGELNDLSNQQQLCL